MTNPPLHPFDPWGNHEKRIRAEERRKVVSGGSSVTPAGDITYGGIIETASSFARSVALFGPTLGQQPWVCPDGATLVVVVVVGAGGAGGGGMASIPGAGGGGGQAVLFIFPAIFIGSAQVVVGFGGSVLSALPPQGTVTSPAGNGGNGNDSSFTFFTPAIPGALPSTGVTITAKGGAGGIGGNTASSPVGGLGGGFNVPSDLPAGGAHSINQIGDATEYGGGTGGDVDSITGQGHIGGSSYFGGGGGGAGGKPAIARVFGGRAGTPLSYQAKSTAGIGGGGLPASAGFFYGPYAGTGGDGGAAALTGSGGTGFDGGDVFDPAYGGGGGGGGGGDTGHKGGNGGVGGPGVVVVYTI